MIEAAHRRGMVRHAAILGGLMLLAATASNCADSTTNDAQGPVALQPDVPQSVALQADVDHLLVARQYPQALQILRIAAADTGSDSARRAQVHFLLGNTHAQLGNLDSSAANYRRAVALRPGHARAWHNLGIVLADRGQHRDAVEAIQRAVDLDSTFAEAHESLGLLAMKVGDYTRARIALRRATRMSDALSPLRSLGMLLTRDGDYDAAHAVLQRAIELSPTDSESHRLLGLLYLARGEAERAVEALVVATESDSGNTEAFFNLAAASRALGDTAMMTQAVSRFERLRQGAADIAQLRRILDADPSNVDGRLALAQLYDQQGDTDAAIRHLQAALTNDPDHLDARLHLSRLYTKTGQPEMAMVTLAERKHDDSLRWHLALAYLQMQRGDATTAAREFERVIKLDSTHSQAWSGLGDVRLMQNDRLAASTAYRRSLQLPTPRPEAAVNLGTLHAQAGRLDSAIIYYQRAEHLGGDAVRITLALGALNEQAGHTQRAIDAYERFLALKMGNTQLEQQVRQTIAQLRLQSPGTQRAMREEKSQ